MDLENELSEEEIEDNWEFIKCDKKDCEEFGKCALCYFEIYRNCFLYEQ